MTENIENATGPPWKHIIGAVVLIAFVIAAMVQAANGDDGTDPDQNTGVPRGEAWDSCKQAVIEQLTNPSTADFALLSTDFADQPHGGWSIAGTVSAENAFGVEREIAYSCEVSASGSVRATVS